MTYTTALPELLARTSLFMAEQLADLGIPPDELADAMLQAFVTVVSADRPPVDAFRDAAARLIAAAERIDRGEVP